MSLSGQDWVTCLNHCLPLSGRRRFRFRPLLQSYRLHRGRMPRLQCPAPVRALRIYIDRSASFRQSDQLFVCYGGSTKGRAVSKQRLSHWIVDAIMEAYASQGLECPLHIRGHSTRAIASSWAWSRGMSIPDICLAAVWSSQNTFARFYKLDVQSLASQVLSVSN